MEKIKNVWFDNNRIYIRLEDETVYNRPLEAFPLLMEATDSQRENFVINKYGDALRWKDVDEDIHINSFLETTEPNRDNVVANMLKRFPWIDLTELSRVMNVHKSVLMLYINGIKQPTKERIELLRDTLHIMGHDLLTA